MYHVISARLRFRHRPLHQYVLVAVLLVAIAILSIYWLVIRSPAPDITVDFGRTTSDVNPLAFSGSISTYGEDGGDIVRSPGGKQSTLLRQLGPGLWRVPLKLESGRIVSAAAYVSGDISGDQWVGAIEGFAGTPQIVVEGSRGNNFTPQQAADMERHFRGVRYWVLGNEPDAPSENGGIGLKAYCTKFNQSAEAMRAVNPHILIAGPAWSSYNLLALSDFLKCAGRNVDIIDFHHYGMGDSALSTATALAHTADYGKEIRAVRQLVGRKIQVEVGEFNWSWRIDDGWHGWHGDDRFYQAAATVWGASVIGHIVAAGGIAHPYADQGGALGLTFEKSADAAHYGRQVGDPMPLYWGEIMFTGGQYFRHFGSSLVQATSKQPGIEVFASSHPQDLVLINKTGSASTTLIAIHGAFSRTVTVWQTNPDRPFSAPRDDHMKIEGAQLKVALPPYSVTTILPG
jgi:hypothetical protein